MGASVEYTALMAGRRWSTRLPGLLGSVRLVVARPAPRLCEVIAQARLDIRRPRWRHDLLRHDSGHGDL